MTVDLEKLRRRWKWTGNQSNYAAYNELRAAFDELEELRARYPAPTLPGSMPDLDVIERWMRSAAGTQIAAFGDALDECIAAMRRELGKK